MSIRYLPPGRICLAAITLLLVGLELAPGQFTELLQYHSRLIGEGQLWRLLTGHLVHLGPAHLLLNLCGLWLIWLLFLPQPGNIDGCYLLPLIAIGCSLCLYLFSPEVIWYRGLSGVLHGLLIWALLRQFTVNPYLHALLLALITAKLVWEQLTGALPGSGLLTDGQVIVDSHLFGALNGGLLWVLQSAVKLLKGQTAK